jgi:hypothetical protein
MLCLLIVSCGSQGTAAISIPSIDVEVGAGALSVNCDDELVRCKVCYVDGCFEAVWSEQEHKLVLPVGE